MGDITFVDIKNYCHASRQESVQFNLVVVIVNVLERLGFIQSDGASR